MVIHEGARRDALRIAEAALDGKLGQVFLQRLVDIQLALFGQLHRSRCRENLGDGTQVINRIRRGFDVCLLVGIAEALRPHHLLIVHQRDTQPGDIVFRDPLFYHPADVLFGITVIAEGKSKGFLRRGAASTQDEYEKNYNNSTQLHNNSLGTDHSLNGCHCIMPRKIPYIT